MARCCDDFSNKSTLNEVFNRNWNADVADGTT